jgi:hypothetical protein
MWFRIGLSFELFCMMLRTFGFPQKAVNFLTKLLLDSPEGFSFMKLASAFCILG